MEPIEKIEHGNRLLAKMCADKDGKGLPAILHHALEIGRINTLKFHSDWNWTMEAARIVKYALDNMLLNGENVEKARFLRAQIKVRLTHFHETPRPVFNALVEAAIWLEEIEKGEPKS